MINIKARYAHTCGIIKKNHGWALIRVWALNRDNTVHGIIAIVHYGWSVFTNELVQD